MSFLFTTFPSFFSFSKLGKGRLLIPKRLWLTFQLVHLPLGDAAGQVGDEQHAPPPVHRVGKQPAVVRHHREEEEKVRHHSDDQK